MKEPLGETTSNNDDCEPASGGKEEIDYELRFKMVQLTAEPPLEAICQEIVNMILESVEVHGGGLLHFHFLDGMELEIDTEEE